MFIKEFTFRQGDTYIQTFQNRLETNHSDEITTKNTIVFISKTKTVIVTFLFLTTLFLFDLF